MSTLTRTAEQLVRAGRGILAADESIRTMSQRLEAEGIEASPTSRRDYRELLLTAPRLSTWVSGIILCDETFRQQLTDGTDVPRGCRARGILPGIKVDTGTTTLAGGEGALITEGLDGLDGRLAEYAELGAAFAKWRAVFATSSASDYAIRTNAHALARYARLCQEHDIVPIVEPELLCTGGHDAQAAELATSRILRALFDELAAQRVALDAIVLKPSFVTPAIELGDPDPQQVGAATARVLRERVPGIVPGIAFLSGGWSPALAREFLETTTTSAQSASWALTFSFGRALVSPALHTWAGEPANVAAAQQVLADACQAAAAVVQQPAAA